MRRTRWTWILLLVALVLNGACPLLWGGPVSAHAKVISATPGIGSTIATAPTTVTVVCAENLTPDPIRTTLVVYGPTGDVVSQGRATISLPDPTRMSVPLHAQGVGIYVVRWTTESADDHESDEGAFVFTVKGGATTPTPISVKLSKDELSKKRRRISMTSGMSEGKLLETAITMRCPFESKGPS